MRRRGDCAVASSIQERLFFLPEEWPHSTCNLDGYTVGVGYFGAIDGFSAAERVAIIGNWSHLQPLLAEPAIAEVGHLLELAAESGHADVAKGLLNNGAKSTRVDARGRTPLHIASKNGWPDVVSLLLQSRAAWDAEDNDGNLPMLEASYAGHLAVIRALCGCSDESHIDCTSIALCSNASGKFGGNPLRSAAKGGHLPIASFLLDKAGVSVQVVGSDGEGPLSHAASSGHIPLVDFLLDHRADINYGPIGPLSVAAKRGHAASVEKLLHRNADSSRATSNGQTVLIFAARRQKEDMVKLLLLNRAKVDTVDSEGQTAMHVAAGIGRAENVELLLAARASVLVEDKRGRNALDEAARLGHVAVLERLLGGEGLQARALAVKTLRFLDTIPNEELVSESRQFLELVRDGTREF